MNEQAIQDSYDLFVQSGYTKSIDEYKKLIASNENALNDSYSLFVQNGYAKTIDDYKSLVGLTSEPLKKKEDQSAELSTGSTTEVGSSVSSEPTDENSRIKEAASRALANVKSMGEDKTDYISRKLKTGTVSLIANVYRTPELIYDVAANAYNKLLEGQDYLLGTESGQVATSTELGKMMGVKNVAADDLEKYVANQRAIESKYDVSISDAIAKGEYGTAGMAIAGSIAESLPFTIGLIIPSAAGVSATRMFGGISAVMAAGRKEELKDRTDLSESQKNVNSILYGVAEGMEVLLGAGSAGRAIGDIVRREGVEQGKKVGKVVLEKLLKDNVYLQPFSESLQEGITQYVQNAADIYINGEDKKLTDGVADAMIVGGIMGSGFTALGKGVELVNNITEDKNKKKGSLIPTKQFTPEEVEIVDGLANDGKTYEKLVGDINDRVKSGELTQDKADDMRKNLDETVSAVKSIPTDLTKEQRAKALGLIREKQALKTQIEGKDNALTVPQRDRIAEIDNQLTAIATEPIQENIVEEKVVSEEEKSLALTKLREYWSDMYFANRNSDILNDGFVNTPAFNRSLPYGSDEIASHGLAKSGLGAALNDLINLFSNGIDINRRGGLDVAPLTNSSGSQAGTTGGGTSYRDGAFILLANKGHVGKITNINQVGGILVNNGITDLYPEILTNLQKLFPNLVVESYNNTAEAVQQLNNKQKSLTKKPIQDAIQKPSSEKIVLRNERPEVGLQEVGKGNEQQEVTKKTTQEEIADIERRREEEKDLYKDVSLVLKNNVESIINEDVNVSVKENDRGIKVFIKNTNGKNVLTVTYNNLNLDGTYEPGILETNIDYRGKGIASKVYEVVNNYLILNKKGSIQTKEGNFVATSATGGVKMAEKMWDSMIRKGIAKKSDNIYKMLETVYSKYDAELAALNHTQEITIDRKAIVKNTKWGIANVATHPIENETGATFNLDGTTYDGEGLIVTLISEDNLTQADITPEKIADFVEQHKDKIGSDNIKVGLYKFENSDRVSLDLNVVVPKENQDAALEFAKQIGQNSIYDPSTNQTLQTGESGANTKKLSTEEIKTAAALLSKVVSPETKLEAQDLASIMNKEDGPQFKKEDEDLIKGTKAHPNMTEDGEGNYVFYHVGNEGYKTIDPRKSGNSLATSKDEKRAMSKAGGLSMYYTTRGMSERMVQGMAKYMVKVPKSEVYYFNDDPLNLIDEAEKRFNEQFPGQAFDFNTQVAMVTKIANEKGFKMVVADWNGGIRAQTTQAMKPYDVQIKRMFSADKKFKNEYPSVSELTVVPTPTDESGNLPEPSFKVKREFDENAHAIEKETKDQVVEGQTVSTVLTRDADIHERNDKTIGIDSIIGEAKTNKNALDQAIKVAKILVGYDIIKNKIEVNTLEDAVSVFEEFKNGVKENLRWLYDQVDDGIHTVSKLWYDGANKIANEISKRTGYSLEQVSGVMAVLSPQKDWFKNLSLGERLINTYTSQQENMIDNKMVDYLLTATTGTGKKIKLLLPSAKKITDKMVGIKFKNLSTPLQAYYIRAFDEVYNGREYNNITPNGVVNGLVKSDNGKNTKVAWGSFSTIIKGISILKDASIKNISSNLGMQHKVRNFFNNISNPNDKTSVTIDTHAVAAGLLKALAGEDAEVLFNFGVVKSNVTGVSGSYPIYADAYRELASELGLDPRELQSITWEAARGLFTDKFKKSKKNKELINNIWKLFNQDKITKEELYERISKEAGGVSKPIWYEYLAEGDIETYERNSAATNQGELSDDAQQRRSAGPTGGTDGDIELTIQLSAFMNKAFPSTAVYVDQQTFDNVVASPEVTKYLKNGEVVYGMTKDGDIYVNPKVHDSSSKLFNTAIHEFGHVWIDNLMGTEKGRAIYAKGSELIRKTERYKTLLAQFKANGIKNAEISATKEVMAEMIGNKGETIVNEILKDKFVNWLKNLWTYIRDKFKMSKDLTSEDIENMTMDEFLGMALADIFSEQSVEVRASNFKDVKNPGVAFSKTQNIHDVVRTGRENGFSDASIDYYLRQGGFSVAEINDAMRVNIDTFGPLPKSFGNVEGGINEGIKMYGEIIGQLVKEYDKKISEVAKGAGKATLEIRQRASQILKDHPLYKSSSEKVQKQLEIDLQESLNIRKAKQISQDVSDLKAELRQRKAAEKNLKKIQTQLRIFIRKSLPRSEYENGRVNKLIRLATDATEENIRVIVDQVIDEVTMQTVKDLKTELNDLLNTKTTKNQGATKKGTLLPDAQDRLEKIKSDLMDEKADPEAIQKKIDELNEEYNELDSESVLEDEDLDRMIDIQTTIAYNQSLLLDDKEVAKVEALNYAIDNLNIFLTEARNSYKEAIKAQKDYYNRIKSEFFRDVTGITIDFGSKESIANARLELNKVNNLKNNRPRFVQYLEKLLLGLQKPITSTEAMEGILDRISRMPGEMFEGKSEELILSKLNESTNKYKQGIIEINNFITEFAEEILGKDFKKKSRENSKKLFFYYVDPAAAKGLESQLESANTEKEKSNIRFELSKLMTPISQNEMYYIYNQFKDEANHAGFETKFGPQYKEIIDEITSKLKPEVKEWADWQVDVFYPTAYKKYNDVYRELNRANMPWNSKYAGSISREGDPLNVDMLANATQYQTAVSSSPTKLRVKNKKAIRIKDGDKALAAYSKEMEYYAAYAVNMRDIIKMVKNPDVKNGIIVTTGKDAYALLENNIDKFLGRTMYSSGEFSFIDHFSRAFIVNKIGGSVSVWLKQLSSAAAFIDYIGYRNWIKAAAMSPMEWKAQWKEMRANSIFLIDRFEYSHIEKTLGAYSDDTAASFLDGNMIDKGVDIIMYMSKNGDKLGITGSIPNYVYLKEKFRKENPGWSKEKVIAESIKVVENQIKTIAVSNDPQDKDVFQLGHPFVRTFNIFLSQPKAYFRKEIIAARNLYRKLDGKQSKGTYRDNLRTLFTYHLFMPMFVQWIASGIPGIIGDWDDEDSEDMLRAAILGNFNALFALGDIITGIADVIQDKPWAGRMRNLPILSESERVIQEIGYYKKATDEDKKQKHLFNIIKEVGGATTGIPLNTLHKVGVNYSKLLTGDVKNTDEAILRLFNFSEYQIQKKDKEVTGSPKPKAGQENQAIKAAKKRAADRKKRARD